MSQWEHNAQKKHRNWARYNGKLINRGELKNKLLKKLVHWAREISRSNAQKKGHPFYYPACLFQYLIFLRCVDKTPYRALQGEAEALCILFGYHAPHYGTIWKRCQELNLIGFLKITIPFCHRDIAVDSTGQKTTPRGEWLRYAHHGKRRKGWTKLHVVADVENQLIVGNVITTEKLKDDQEFQPLIHQALENGTIGIVYGDKGYDIRAVFNEISYLKATPGILPRRNANRRARGCPLRGQIVWKVQKMGRKRWKQKSGYARRGSVERVFSTFKRLFGETVMARKFQQIERELLWKIQIYNHYILTEQILE